MIEFIDAQGFTRRLFRVQINRKFLKEINDFELPQPDAGFRRLDGIFAHLLANGMLEVHWEDQSIYSGELHREHQAAVNYFPFFIAEREQWSEGCERDAEDHNRSAAEIDLQLWMNNQPRPL